MDIMMYCDVSPKEMVADETVRALSGTPVTTLAINVETSKGERRYTANQLRSVCAAYPGYHLRPVFWPSPGFNRGYVDWVRSVEGLLRGTPVMDQEHNWIGVSDALDMAALWAFGDFRLTTHTGHELVRRPASALVSRLAHELEVQALSVDERNGKKIDPNGRLGPGGMQREAVRLGEQTSGRKPFVTLPLYKQQDWPGGPIEAMKKELRACKEEGVPGVSYWSLKHFLRIGYARDFLTNHARSVLS